MAKWPALGDFLTNLDQPMPFHEKLVRLARNLWRRVALRQSCCGNYGEPGC
jgi:predicted secreted protein